ncbi:MAG: RT0821/Lpp0805 family surface protein [Rhizobiaceae bacterium]
MNAMKRLAVLCICCASLAACASGIDMSKIDVDTITTSSATGAETVPDQTRVSDSVTIRNAVSAIDVEEHGSGPLAWANAETGSRGTISDLSETREDGVICRRFTASRESFDGVGLYKGETCLGAQGDWLMRAFDRM